eukprot:6204589-Pyramimonas_sp.AAC.1
MGPRSAAMGGEAHANCASGAFGGAPYGATKRCPGWERRMRTPRLRPSLELHMGPRSAALGGGTACAHPHWDL